MAALWWAFRGTDRRVLSRELSFHAVKFLSCRRDAQVARHRLIEIPSAPNAYRAAVALIDNINSVLLS